MLDDTVHIVYKFMPGPSKGSPLSSKCYTVSHVHMLQQLGYHNKQDEMICSRWVEGCTWEAKPGGCKPRAARALSSYVAFPAPQNLTVYPCSSASPLPHPSNSARVLHAQTRMSSAAASPALMALRPVASTSQPPHSPCMRICMRICMHTSRHATVLLVS